MLGVLLSGYKENFDPMVLDRCLSPLIDILLDSKIDRGLNKASLCTILPIIYRGSHLLANWRHRVTGQSAIDCILRIVERYLQSTDEFLAMNTPPIVTLLIQRQSELIAPHLPTLLNLSLRTLLTCKLPSFKQALIVIFARLVLVHTEQVVAYLWTVNLGGEPAIGPVLNEWTKYHSDIHTRLDTNVSSMALTKLFSVKDARLERLYVDGSIIQPDVVARTRAQARLASQHIKWTKAPLFQKIVVVLLETYDLEMFDREKAERKAEAKAINYGRQDLDQDLFDDEDDDEDDEGDFDPDNADFEPAEDYEDLIDGDDDSDYSFEDDDFDPIGKEDPLYNIDITLNSSRI
eukprot:gene16940-20152_t